MSHTLLMTNTEINPSNLTIGSLLFVAGKRAPLMVTAIEPNVWHVETKTGSTIITRGANCWVMFPIHRGYPKQIEITGHIPCAPVAEVAA
jgi:hypothetical protein